MSASSRRAIWIACLAAALTSGRGLPAQDARGQDVPPPPVPFRMSSMVMNWSVEGPEKIRIVVERWSTDDEHQMLLDTLVEKGSNDLDDVIENIERRAGFIDTTNSMAWDIQYAQATPTPNGGRHILFLMYRVNGPNGWDYFDVGEVDVDRDGKGEGKLTVAKKATYDTAKNEIVLHLHGGREPLRLKRVRVEP